MNNTISLTGLDGANPLAFLASLGMLRLLHLRDERQLRLRWIFDSCWTPQINGFSGSPGDLCQALLEAPHVPCESFSLLGKNITVSPVTFREFIQAADNATQSDRRMADFAASFGSEACKNKDGDRIQYSDFCFITGSGHQHFLGTIEELVKNVTADHIGNALFGPWKRDKGLSMRWDPKEAAQYALRWNDPSTDGASSVWGANRLAIESLPLFPTQPTQQGLRTTGVLPPQRRGDWPHFTWPIWTDWANLDTVRSLLSLSELHVEDGEFTRDGLEQRGIAEVYRSQRVRIPPSGAQYKVSFRPSRAI